MIDQNELNALRDPLATLAEGFSDLPEFVCLRSCLLKSGQLDRVGEIGAILDDVAR